MSKDVVFNVPSKWEIRTNDKGIYSLCNRMQRHAANSFMLELGVLHYGDSGLKGLPNFLGFLSIIWRQGLIPDLDLILYHWNKNNED